MCQFDDLDLTAPDEFVVVLRSKVSSDFLRSHSSYHTK